jgi:hypothetical protein
MINPTLPLIRSLADLAVESILQVGTAALGRADGYKKVQIAYPLPVIAGVSIA